MSTVTSTPYLKFSAYTRALQECIGPSVLSLTERQRLEGWSFVNALIMEKIQSDKWIIRKIRIFLFLVQALALCSYGRKFQKLDRVRQTHLLGRFRNSPIAVIRKGFWGLSTLIKLSVYAHPRTQRQIEYYPNLAIRVALDAD